MAQMLQDHRVKANTDTPLSISHGLIISLFTADPYSEFPPSENKDYRNQVNQLPNTASIMRNVSHTGDRARNNRSYSSAEEFEQGSSGFRGLYSRESYARGQPTPNSDDNGPPSEPYPPPPSAAPNPGPADNVAPLPLDPRLRDRDDRSLVYYDHPAEDGLQAPPPPGVAVPHPHGLTLALRDPIREPESPAAVPAKRSASSKSEPKPKRGPRMEVGPDGTTIRKNKVNQACEPCRSMSLHAVACFVAHFCLVVLYREQSQV
jgi:hypothetical protein